MNVIPSKRPIRANVSRGFSLVELMIALTIGLVVIAAAGYTYSASKRIFRQNDGLARVQDSTRGTLLMMNGIIRNAGFLPEPLYETNPLQYFYLSGAINTLPIYGGRGATLPLSGLPASNPTPDPNSDWVMISYMGCGISSTPNYDCYGGTKNATVDRTLSPNVISLRSCLGETVPSSTASAVNQQVVVNLFYVGHYSTDPANVNSLVCATRFYDASSYDSVNQRFSLTALGAAPNYQQLMQGVSRMTAVYGLDTSGARQTTQRVVSTALGTSSATSPNWYQVSMVQLNLTTQNGELVAYGSQANMGHFQNGLYQAQQTQSVAIRNRLQ